MPAQRLCIGIETEEDSLVDQGVLLLGPGTLLDFLTSGANDRLDFVAVDEAGDVGVRDLGVGKAERINI